MIPQHLLVSVGGERYALPLRDVAEVARIGPLTPVPGAPHAVLGVHNLRGQVIPVVDLGSVLGVRAGEELRSVVIVDDAGDPAALAVDVVLDVGTVDARPDETVDAPLSSSAVAGGRLVGVIDVSGALRLARGMA